MFTKILMANRGEIACRVAATARRMGIQTVMVYSEADARARHVQAGDLAVCIGGPAASESYLCADRILRVARETGAQAIHPGYGFLSENEAFAQACADAGIVFIGPSPAAIRAMGLKAESKRLMQAAGVPLVPGYHEAEQDPLLLQRAADAIGYPVLIKASAGGGGKGMRVVTQASDFAAALASCQREAAASFGNDAVLLERCLRRPRHIEMQVFGDHQGQVISLFERDCSVQRRHQKVLEEAPAPGLSEALRQKMGEAAVAAAKAVGYVGAGTVEFIAEPGDSPDAVEGLVFYFMEMNTRLQVEHPVTEAITGLDLVEWQLRVAAGEPLPLGQAQVSRRGHAIEARLCAENPEAQFLPSTGPLEVCRWPEAVRFQPGFVRLDTGFQQGDMVSPYYDAMLAKLIAWGETREQALNRLSVALSQTQLLGLHTNVAFLRRLLASPSFVQADLDTALIERERPVLFGQAPLAWPWLLAAVAAQSLFGASENPLPAPWSDPWSGAKWRLQGELCWYWTLNIQSEVVRARLVQSHQGSFELRWSKNSESGSAPWQAVAQGQGVFDVALGDVWTRLQIDTLKAGAQRASRAWAVLAPHAEGWVEEYFPGEDLDNIVREGLQAPMPGKVLLVMVQPGDTVRRGQSVAVMEAMKMEHTLYAPYDGKVQELIYRAGDQMPEGAALLRLQKIT
ncbi:MAG: biotin carboxylase N-terminal domain-containing protein [Burkholderiales bacterium]